MIAKKYCNWFELKIKCELLEEMRKIKKQIQKNNYKGMPTQNVGYVASDTSHYVKDLLKQDGAEGFIALMKSLAKK